MNKTKIDWCDYTWNPVTGCLNNCDYCYARKIANRFHGGFEPTFHKKRLEEPQRVKSSKRIFVCSMADLFGAWIPDEWIKEVFKACKKAPQHQYIFLTKNPKRYEEILNNYNYYYNWWFGTTITKPSDYREFRIEGGAKVFLNIEPLLGSFEGINIKGWDWVIIGQQTNPNIIPETSWVSDILYKCEKQKIPKFVKKPLLDRIVYSRNPIQEYPEGLKCD